MLFLLIICIDGKLKIEIADNSLAMRLDLVSKSLESVEFKTERWFDSRFTEEQIPLSYIEKWMKTEKVDAPFHPPPPNKFLPTGFDARTGHQMMPFMFLNKPRLKMWHMWEDCLATVKLCIYLKVDGVDAQIMTELFISLLKDSMSEILYQGKEAMFKTSLKLSEYNKVVLKVKGYRERLGDYLAEIWKHFHSFHPTTNRFEIIREAMGRSLSSSILDIEKHSDYLLLDMTRSGVFSVDEKLSALRSISHDPLTRFVSGLRLVMLIEGVCYGDLLFEEAEQITKVFCDIQSSSSLPEGFRDIQRIDIPRGYKVWRTSQVKVQTDENSLAKVLFQIGNNKNAERKNACLLLFNSIIEAKLVQQLRAEENLGYDVGCKTDYIDGRNIFAVTVLSSLNNPAKLLTRINHFIENCGDLLDAGIVSRLQSWCCQWIGLGLWG